MKILSVVSGLGGVILVSINERNQIMASTNKLVIGFGSLAAVTVIAFAGSAAVLADSENQGGALADKIATKFNLNKEDVQATIGEHRGQKGANRGVRQEANLSAAVQEGKITEEQKQALIAKYKEVAGERGSRQGSSQEERDAARAEHRAGMESWAAENGINLDDLHEGMEKGGPRGERKGMGGPGR